jgi:hypothetical protein
VAMSGTVKAGKIATNINDVHNHITGSDHRPHNSCGMSVSNDMRFLQPRQKYTALLGVGKR